MIALVSVLLLAQADVKQLYQVNASIAPTVKVGETAKLDVKFSVASNAHISDEAPLTIKVSGDGVSFDKSVLHYKDALPPPGPAPRFALGVKADAPGEHAVSLDLTFYVCTAELCNRTSEHRTVTLAAK